MRSPAWLTTTGKSYWQRLHPYVDLEDRTAYETLSLLCDHYATYRTAAKQIADEGLTVATSVGGLKPHPAVNIKNCASEQIRRLSRDLGLGINEPNIDTSDDVVDGLQ